MCVAEQNSRECFRVLCAQGSAGRSGAAPAQGPTALLYLAALLSVLSRSPVWPSPDQKSGSVYLFCERCDPDPEDVTKVPTAS